MPLVILYFLINVCCVSLLIKCFVSFVFHRFDVRTTNSRFKTKAIPSDFRIRSCTYSYCALNWPAVQICNTAAVLLYL